jgi:hypothetical protein
VKRALIKYVLRINEMLRERRNRKKGKKRNKKLKNEEK